MIIIVSTDGKLLCAPSTIPQGTILNNVVILSPKMYADVVLKIQPANQEYIEDIIPALAFDEAIRPTVDGMNLDEMMVWTATIPQKVSYYAGKANYQVKMVDNEGNVFVSEMGSFTVSKGVVSDMPDSVEDLSQYSLNQIYQALANIPLIKELADESANSALRAWKSAEQAGIEASQANEKASQANEKASQANEKASQANEKAKRAEARSEYASLLAEEANDKAVQANNRAEEAIIDAAQVNGKKLDKHTGSHEGSTVAYVQRSGNVDGVTIVTAAKASSTIMLRNSTGRSEIETPAKDYDIANKIYVDSALDGKVDRMDFSDSPYSYAYVESNNSVKGIPIKTNPDGASIMYRDNSGRSQIMKPVQNNDISNKKYVDDQINNLKSIYQGVGRTFVLDGFLNLVDFLNFTSSYIIDVIGNQVTQEQMKTGDVIYIIDTQVPDFWWVEGESYTAPTITFDGIQYTMQAYDEEAGMVIGTAQFLETSIQQAQEYTDYQIEENIYDLMQEIADTYIHYPNQPSGQTFLVGTEQDPALGEKSVKAVEYSENPMPNTIPMRDDNGNIKVGIPSNEADAVPKSYADDKVAKMHFTNPSRPYYAYVHGSKGSDIGVALQTDNAGSSLIYRDSSGRASISSPTIGTHITNKDYVDGQKDAIDTDISNLNRRINNLENKLGNVNYEDTFTKVVSAGNSVVSNDACPYIELNRIGGMTRKTDNLVYNPDTITLGPYSESIFNFNPIADATYTISFIDDGVFDVSDISVNVFDNDTSQNYSFVQGHFNCFYCTFQNTLGADVKIALSSSLAESIEIRGLAVNRGDKRILDTTFYPNFRHHEPLSIECSLNDNLIDYSSFSAYKNVSNIDVGSSYLNVTRDASSNSSAVIKSNVLYPKGTYCFRADCNHTPFYAAIFPVKDCEITLPADLPSSGTGYYYDYYHAVMQSGYGYEVGGLYATAFTVPEDFYIGFEIPNDNVSIDSVGLYKFTNKSELPISIVSPRYSTFNLPEDVLLQCSEINLGVFPYNYSSDMLLPDTFNHIEFGIQNSRYNKFFYEVKFTGEETDWVELNSSNLDELSLASGFHIYGIASFTSVIGVPFQASQLISSQGSMLCNIFEAWEENIYFQGFGVIQADGQQYLAFCTDNYTTLSSWKEYLVSLKSQNKPLSVIVRYVGSTSTREIDYVAENVIASSPQGIIRTDGNISYTTQVRFG